MLCVVENGSLYSSWRELLCYEFVIIDMNKMLYASRTRKIMEVLQLIRLVVARWQYVGGEVLGAKFLAL